MVVGAVGGRTELAVLGAGPGGYVAALRAADAGLEVTLIERDHLGGTCLNVGCIPSKTLIELANTRSTALQAETKGLTSSIKVDAIRMADHITATTRQLRGGVASLLRSAGVTVVPGDASFARYDRLSIVDGDLVSHLEYDNVIIATGSRPVELPGLPFGDRILSSTEALGLRAVPASMCVIGGGYIGIELGTAWAKLGAAVTIIEASASILPATAAQLRRPVEQRLTELGIDVRVNCTVESVTDSTVLLSDGSALPAEAVVVAVGRRPNSDRSGIGMLPIQVAPSGHILVDARMRADRGIYAIGDLVDGPALAHKATAEAEIAVDAILGHPTTEPSPIPAVIFSDPEIMSVGVPLDAAEATGLRVHRFPHSASARARTVDVSLGATYLVTDDADTILGVHAVGPHASELAGEATLAVAMAAVLDDVAFAVHPHPTMGETFVEAALLGTGRPLHIRR